MPDYSLVENLFSDSPVRKESIQRLSGRKATKTATNRKDLMNYKLSKGKFKDFDEKDWFQYFVLKAKQNNVRYLQRNYAKDYAILKSIMGELSPEEIKNMIDFVWDCDHDIYSPKSTMGIWILSKGWINTIYQNSVLWAEGKYKPKNAPMRNREWVDEASVKPTEEEVKVDKKKPVIRKKKVTIGWGD